MRLLIRNVLILAASSFIISIALTASIIKFSVPRQLARVEAPAQVPLGDTKGRFFFHLTTDNEEPIKLLNEMFETCPERQTLPFEEFSTFIKFRPEDPESSDKSSFIAVIEKDKVTYLFSIWKKYAVKSTYELPMPNFFPILYQVKKIEYGKRLPNDNIPGTQYWISRKFEAVGNTGSLLFIFIPFWLFMIITGVLALTFMQIKKPES